MLAINLVSSINLLGLPASALAAEPPAGPTPAQRAKQHYLKGEAYFKARDFSAAMGEYQSGYEEKADPVFVFNIAQCQRLLGHPGPALESYRRYLREAPEGAGRPVAERQIAELERLTGGDGAVPSAIPVQKPPSMAGTTDATPPHPAPQLQTLQTPRTSPAPSSPPRAAAPDPFAPPPASGAPSEQPTTPSTRSLAATDTSASTVAASPALAIRSAEEPPRPIYRRWWFWAAAGALSIAAIVAVAAASSGGQPACDAGRVCR